MKNETRRYSKDFYRLNAIKRAVIDYKKLASISVTEEEDYYVCEFSDCITESRRIIFEFDNYLLEIMNSEGECNEV